MLCSVWHNIDTPTIDDEIAQQHTLSIDENTISKNEAICIVVMIKDLYLVYLTFIICMYLVLYPI